MKILITGGAGFIGLNFINYTLKHHPGDEIICFDKLTYAADSTAVKRLADEKKITFVQGDIADAAAVGRLFCAEKFDAVVNFAAETHVDRSIKFPAEFVRSNVTGVQVLLDMCLKYGVLRFHQISTDEVYGSAAKMPFDESAALVPTSVYAASKAAADLIALSYFKTHNLEVTVERSSNNYGAYQHPEKLIPLAISRALGGQKIPLYGTGENRRCWLYITDHCRATDMLLRRGRAGEIYNISAESEKTNIEVVRAILAKLNMPDNLISFVKDRAGHDLQYTIDSSKIKNELNWRDETDFDSGLGQTVDWYLNNRARLHEITSSAQYKEYFKDIYGGELF
ncbi:MAG: dTDP-glucose 4,6-dehydratase [Clostridiales bacterium]|nr:dTDP-glucose 4,6-dehydratase [Clostridiales bacterium]